MKLALKLALVQSVAIAVVFALHTAWSVDRARTRTAATWAAAWEAQREHPGVIAPISPPAAPEVLEEIALDRVLAALLVLLVAFIVLVGVSVRVVGRPLARFLAHSRLVGQGELHARVPAGGRDEVGALADGMNHMTEQLAKERARYATEHARRVATTAQLRHAERLKILGELAAATAHEMGTPLNVIRGRARLITKDPTTSEASAQSAEVIIAQTDRLASRIRGVLGFARRRSHMEDAVDLAEVVTSSVDLLSPLLATLQVDVSVTTAGDGGPAIVRGDASQLEQVMANLLMNAAQAMPGGGEVVVRVARAAGGAGVEGDLVRVSVIDHGVGMTPEVKAHVFDPFFTTKTGDRGTGLGLSVSEGIVAGHGGRVEVESEPGVGSAFHVVMPAARKP